MRNTLLIEAKHSWFWTFSKIHDRWSQHWQHKSLRPRILGSLLCCQLAFTALLAAACCKANASDTGWKPSRGSFLAHPCISENFLHIFDGLPSKVVNHQFFYLAFLELVVIEFSHLDAQCFKSWWIRLVWRLNTELVSLTACDSSSQLAPLQAS